MLFFLNKPMFYFSGVSFSKYLEHMLFLQCFSAATLKLVLLQKRPKKGIHMFFKKAQGGTILEYRFVIPK